VDTLVAWPVSAFFFLLSLAMAALSLMNVGNALKQGDAVSTWLAVVVGPIGLIGLIVWGLALISALRGRRDPARS